MRLYYLQQLGITAYAPRVALAGALEVEAIAVASEPDAESAGLVDTAADASATAAVTPVAVRESAPVSPVSASRPRLELDSESDKPRAAPKVAPPPAAVKAVVTAERNTATTDDGTADTAAPFQLLFAVASPELALVLQIPALAAPTLREAEARLLQNLLRWLGQKSPDPSSFLPWRWPLPGLPAKAPAAAGRSLHVFLQQAAMEKPFSRLLMLGAMPAQCLQLHYQQQAAEWQCWTTHSLAELLALPELKRDTWRQLQSLHAQLLPSA